jgi:membrane protein YdbS with pleckstrin-like domain
MTDVKIEKNIKPSIAKTALVVIIASFLFTITSSLLRGIDSIIPADTTAWTWAFRIVALVIAIIAVVVTWLNETSTSYTIDGNSLVIRGGNNLGRQDKRIINIHNIVEIKARKTVLGRMFGFAQVQLKVTQIGNHSQRVLLPNITNYDDVIVALQTRIEKTNLRY